MHCCCVCWSRDLHHIDIPTLHHNILVLYLLKVLFVCVQLFRQHTFTPKYTQISISLELKQAFFSVKPRLSRANVRITGVQIRSNLKLRGCYCKIEVQLTKLGNDTLALGVLSDKIHLQNFHRTLLQGASKVAGVVRTKKQSA